MKKLILTISLVALMFGTLGASCPNPDTPTDPYATARTTINIMQATVSGARVAFDGVVAAEKSECTLTLCKKLHPDHASQAYKDCLMADHSTVAEYKQCAKAAQVAPWVYKGFDIAAATCVAGLEAIKLSADLNAAKADKKKTEEICLKVDPAKGEEYLKCVAGKPVKKADWSGITKAGACVTYRSLLMVPPQKKYDFILVAVRTWLKGYGGCQ